MTTTSDRDRASRRRFIATAGAASLALAAPSIVRAQGKQGDQGVGRPPAVGRGQLAGHRST